VAPRTFAPMGADATHMFSFAPRPPEMTMLHSALPRRPRGVFVHHAKPGHEFVICKFIDRLHQFRQTRWPSSTHALTA